MSEIPVAKIQGKKTIVYGSESTALYNRGYYGEPSHNELSLNGFEALHLFELGRINIEFNGLFLNEHELVTYYSSIIPEFMSRYLVYKDLRNRGYIVNQGRGSSFFFRLYARGAIPRKDPAKYYITPLQEGSSIKLIDLSDLIKLSKNSNKTLVFGMVDAVGDVSYLKASKLEPNENGLVNSYSLYKNWDWEDSWKEYEMWDD